MELDGPAGGFVPPPLLCSTMAWSHSLMKMYCLPLKTLTTMMTSRISIKVLEMTMASFSHLMLVLEVEFVLTLFLLMKPALLRFGEANVGGCHLPMASSQWQIWRFVT